MWPVCVAGRGGNEIASAVVVVLNCVLPENPELEKLVLWSDSCEAQNRNSMMTLALKKFIEEHPRIKQI